MGFRRFWKNFRSVPGGFRAFQECSRGYVDVSEGSWTFKSVTIASGIVPGTGTPTVLFQGIWGDSWGDISGALQGISWAVSWAFQESSRGLRLLGLSSKFQTHFGWVPLALQGFSGNYQCVPDLLKILSKIFSNNFTRNSYRNLSIQTHKIPLGISHWFFFPEIYNKICLETSKNLIREFLQVVLHELLHKSL